MLSAVLGARQKQQLPFAPARHVNTREGCWNFLSSQAAFPSRPNTEIKAVASLPALPYGHSSPPGHVLGVGSWSWLVPGLISITANVDICARQVRRASQRFLGNAETCQMPEPKVLGTQMGRCHLSPPQSCAAVI